MKFKLLLTLLICLCLCICFVSCNKDTDTDSSSNSGEQNGNQNTDNGGGSEEGVLYKPGSSLTVVYGDDSLYDYAYDVFSAVGANMTSTPKISNDSGTADVHEVVVGQTNREISRLAYEKLAKLESENEYELPFLIYSDGSSVAIAFEQDANGFNVTLIKAIEAFSQYIGSKDTLEIKEGNLVSGFVDPLIYQEALDEELIAKQWNQLAAAIKIKLENVPGPYRNEKGEEISRDEYCELVVKLLKNMYSLYTDDVISWFANLYEPNGGGYYFSNSARNTIGYLPDIESTNQALNFWAGSGMANQVGGTYADAIPDWMKEQIIYFVKKLQDPNGYFYHPQWGKELLDNKPSRRNRDLEWAGGILSRLGAKPTYDTPSGIKGDGILYDGTRVDTPSEAALTSRLISLKTNSVSKIIAASGSETAISDNLKTKEAFAAYLQQIDIRNNCYGGGNELGTYASQFKERDRQLKEQNADWSPVDMVIEYLNENCYSTTGHWSAVADYNGTNGLLKISGLYNSLGAEMPYPLEAAKSAIASITTDERAQTICYVYNAWFSVTNIMENLTYYSSRADGKELAEEISSKLLADCAAGLVASAEKTATFRREDGSFSYLTTGSSTNAQGMPVAVPNSLEGDVNATEIGIVGTWGHIFGALGLSSNKISLYTESDRQRYIRILESLDAVIKDPEDDDITIMDFEEDDLYYPPVYAELDMRSSGSVTVIKDPENSKNNILSFNSVNNGGDEMVVACDSLRLNASCFVLEFDMMVNSATNGNFLQVSLGNRCYMLMFSIDSSGIHILDISSGSNPRLSNDFAVTVAPKEWHEYKIEYYVGNEESVRIMVYVDGEVVGVTDNYYDAAGTRLKGKEGTPVTSYTEASFLALSYVNCDIYFDNIASYKTNTIYKAFEDPEKQPNINIDAPTGAVVSAPGLGEYFNNPDYNDVAKKFTYDFMGYPSPSFTGPAWGKMVSQNGMLNFERIAPSGSGETYIQYIYAAPTDLTAYKNYCSIYEFDYRVSEADLSNDNAPFRLDDSNYIRFVKNSDGMTWSLGTPDTANIECGKWANIRFEIYYINEYTEIAKVYVDGVYATDVRLTTMSPFNSRLCIYMKKNIEKGTVINIDNMTIIHLDKAYSEEMGEEDAVDTNIPDAQGSGVYYNGDITENATRWSFATGTTPSLSGVNSIAYVKDNKHLIFLKTDAASEAYLNFTSAVPASFTDMAYTVIEFDFYANKITAGSAGMLFRFDDSNYAYFAANDDGESFSIGTKNTAEIKENTWHNIRFEIYYRSAVSADVYVDGVKTEATISITDATAFTSRFLVYTKSSTEVDSFLALDNIFFGHMTKPSDETTTPEGGEGTEPETPVDPDKPTEPEEPKFTLGSGVYYNSTSTAKAYRQWNFNTTGTLNGFSGEAFATGTYVDGVAVLERTASDWSTAHFYYNVAENEFTGDPTGATCKVFEFDYKISDIITNDERNAFRFDGNDYVKFYKNSDGTTLSLGAKDTAVITPGEWCNIRFEFYNVSGTKYMQIYVNNTYAYTQTLTDTANTYNNRIYFYLEAATSVGTTVSVDNLVMAYVVKDYVENPSVDTEPEEPEAPEEPKFTLGSGVYYNSTSTAKAYRQWNFNTTGTLNGFSGEAFATGTYVDGVAVLERTASDWSTAHFYYNVAENEFTGDPTGATCKVFEFDYKISQMFSDTNDGRSLFRLDGGDYVKAYRNSDGTTLSLGAKDTAVITPGEWCNIRFEFYNVSGTKYMQIYVNNTYAYTQTLTDTANTYNNRIYFYLEAATSVGTTVSVDNLVMAYVVKDYEAK